jgi:hypothetical protein
MEIKGILKTEHTAFWYVDAGSRGALERRAARSFAQQQEFGSFSQVHSTAT